MDTCTRCDGDGFDSAYVANCERCGGSGKEPAPDMAGVIARSLALNDAQWARGEITHQVWSDTYIALTNYATSHGLQSVFDRHDDDGEYIAYLAGQRPDPRD